MTSLLNSREEHFTPQGGLKDSMYVYVYNQDGTPLTPCSPAKARKLLRDGRARVLERCPFTIQLLWTCEGHVQDVVLGIDKGSHTTGISRVGNGEVLLSAELHHRLDVKEKMSAGATTAGAAVLANGFDQLGLRIRASSRRSGRLPPSIKTNVEEVIRVAISNHTQTTIWVPVGFRICQLTFEFVGETLKEYHGKYGKANHEWTPEDMLPKPYFDWDYELYRTDKGR